MKETSEVTLWSEENLTMTFRIHQQSYSQQPPIVIASVDQQGEHKTNI